MQTPADAAARKEKIDGVWRMLGLTDEQIRDLNARAEKGQPSLQLKAEDVREVWRLRENKPEELRLKLMQILDHLKTDLKDAPAYIQEGIKSMDSSQAARDAAIDKAVRAATQDPSQ